MAIGKLLRENIALVVGALLPIVVVVFFLLATYIPRYLVDPPQHDFLFVEKHTEYHTEEHPRVSCEIEIDSERRLSVRAFTTKPRSWTSRPRLFLYEHASGQVREIRLSLPRAIENSEAGVAVDVPEFADQVIDSRRIAPDGYEVLDPRRSRGFLVGLFYRSGQRNLAIGKNGAVVAVPSGGASRWPDVRFLGWVVTPPDE